MKKIDIKSVIIGVLGTALIFVSMGAKQKQVFDDIYVNRIHIMDENDEVGLIGASGGSTVMMFNNNKGKQSVMMGIMNGVPGIIMKNSKDEVVNSIGVDKLGNGSMKVYTSKGIKAAQLGTSPYGGGFIAAGSHKNKEVSVLTADENGDGMIFLYDRFGKIGWGMTGKK